MPLIVEGAGAQSNPEQDREGSSPCWALSFIRGPLCQQVDLQQEPNELGTCLNKERKEEKNPLVGYFSISGRFFDLWACSRGTAGWVSDCMVDTSYMICNDGVLVSISKNRQPQHSKCSKKAGHGSSTLHCQLL